MSKCKTCYAEIRWAVTVNGKKIPIDARGDVGGNITLQERPGKPPIAVVLDAAGNAPMPSLQPSAEAPRYLSHFATCPDAEKYRAAGARPKV